MSLTPKTVRNDDDDVNENIFLDVEFFIKYKKTNQKLLSVLKASMLKAAWWCSD